MNKLKKKAITTGVYILVGMIILAFTNPTIGIGVMFVALGVMSYSDMSDPF